jgi:hypothetical protein
MVFFIISMEIRNHADVVMLISGKDSRLRRKYLQNF